MRSELERLKDRQARSSMLDDMHEVICAAWRRDGTCCRYCVDCTAIDEARERIRPQAKEAGQ